MALHSDVSISKLAEQTTNFSGAEIRALCMEAGLMALRNGQTTVNEKNFQQAITRLRPENKDVVPVRMLT
jgi:26S proteasome regulatory subunit T5